MQTSTSDAEDLAAYLRRWSLAIDVDGLGDCWVNAWVVAERLAAEGREAAIYRLRDLKETPDRRWHGPLTPRRFRGGYVPTYTTHYICVHEGTAYDPLAGEPIGLERYSESVFGRPVPFEVCVTSSDVAEAIRDGRRPRLPVQTRP